MKRRNLPIREVCALLGVKPHVLRYWEHEIPLLSPKKTIGGHRSYSRSDLELLFRIRHLLRERKYTLPGVRKKLWTEADADYQDSKAGVATIRSELIDILQRIGELRRKLDSVPRRDHRAEGNEAAMSRRFGSEPR